MRYLPHSKNDVEDMLKTLGLESISELFSSIPEDLILKDQLNIANGLTEWDLTDYFTQVSDKNYSRKSFLGGGSYSHYIPNIINYLTSRSEFLTSYTPYQPEISQGTLQAVFEYQTYISKYLGMDYSNASMYDGATSFVEGVLLSLRATKRDKVLVSLAINPRYLEVLNTYKEAIGFQVIFMDIDKSGKTNLDKMDSLEDIASVVIQSPNYFGVIEDQDLIKPRIGEEKTLFISIFSEILAFSIFNPPGIYGADIACGEGQSFGLSRSFGGPYLGVFAFSQKLLRLAPGRLVGESVDKNGKRSFCLTLATREQHIRRERATSNICSNQGLCVLRVIIYLSLLGSSGLKKLGEINYNNSEYLKRELLKIGCSINFSGETFNEFVVTYPRELSSKKFFDLGYVPGIEVVDKTLPDNSFLITVTEVFKKSDLDSFIEAIGGVL
ncbi:aminomethyl-transferring glycine dehydrogenase subunit GcvPA [Thiospirochaeta perfilievii]|uniref:Aminomethyl-transferring glycine dehydrogenase subunit GcvPA n=1 Tax=Thiospirochaeta perfilievii TaxID=252967 RepID=A0A5C1Q850_9SPIO|nr:aminomethyl-transferring glycine dehydrogenase subunit GcvPA [Thiospirochaeta perfilievii]QEN03508.1 aminomethyl-transferring glycine dehydrogenase subunit GcvPA [Thiospirochaeta perfilievii]